MEIDRLCDTPEDNTTMQLMTLMTHESILPFLTHRALVGRGGPDSKIQRKVGHFGIGQCVLYSSARIRVEGMT